MNIHENNKLSQLGNCLATRNAFQLSEEEAKEIMLLQTNIIKDNYRKVCSKANLSTIDQDFFWRRQFLNPYCFYDLDDTFKNTLPVNL